MRGESFPVPSYLPDRAVPLLPWCRAHVVQCTRRNRDVSQADLWDETIAALLRACVYFKPIPPAGTGGGKDGSPYDEAKAFAVYAKLAVTRGLWRYVLPSQQTNRHRQYRRTPWLPLEDVTQHQWSPEDEVIARESVRLRALLTSAA